MSRGERDNQRKLKVLRHAEKSGHVAGTCRYFGVGKSSFYRWKFACEKLGRRRVHCSKPSALEPSNKTFSITSYSRFPFCIRIVRTDIGHEFQAKRHWARRGSGHPSRLYPARNTTDKP